MWHVCRHIALRYVPLPRGAALRVEPVNEFEQTRMEENVGPGNDFRSGDFSIQAVNAPCLVRREEPRLRWRA